MATGMIEAFTSSIFFLPTIIIGTAVLTFIVFKEFVDPEPDGIEEEALKEVVRGKTEDVVDLFGSDVNKRLSYGITPVGKVEKAWGYKEYKALEDGETFESDSDKYIEEDGEEYKLGDYYFYFKVRPTGIVANLMAYVTDDVFNMSQYTDYMIVEQDFVNDGEVLSIQDEWNPVKIAGVWLPDNENAATFVKDKTFEQIFENTLQLTKDAVRATNKHNLDFDKDIQKLEKEAEMYRKKFGAKGAGMVNEN